MLYATAARYHIIPGRGPCGAALEPRYEAPVEQPQIPRIRYLLFFVNTTNNSDSNNSNTSFKNNASNNNNNNNNIVFPGLCRRFLEVTY